MRSAARKASAATPDAEEGGRWRLADQARRCGRAGSRRRPGPTTGRCRRRPAARRRRRRLRWSARPRGGRVTRLGRPRSPPSASSSARRSASISVEHRLDRRVEPAQVARRRRPRPTARACGPPPRRAGRPAGAAGSGRRRGRRPAGRPWPAAPEGLGGPGQAGVTRGLLSTVASTRCRSASTPWLSIWRRDVLQRLAPPGDPPASSTPRCSCSPISPAGRGAGPGRPRRSRCGSGSGPAAPAARHCATARAARTGRCAAGAALAGVAAPHGDGGGDDPRHDGEHDRPDTPPPTRIPMAAPVPASRIDRRRHPGHHGVTGEHAAARRQKLEMTAAKTLVMEAGSEAL